MRLYAAVTQSEQPGNPHGLQHAWAYLARYAETSPMSVHVHRRTCSVVLESHQQPVCKVSCAAPRLLNSLPPTRLTATALEAFLRVTGFRLYGVFRGQFVKLLHYIDREFLAALQQVRAK